MRKKEVTIEGETFEISPLNFDQVEEFFTGREQAPATSKELANFSIEVIAASLNNAAGEGTHTVQSLRKELDNVIAPALYMEILEYSGLKSVPKETEPVEGEAPAASAN